MGYSIQPVQIWTNGTAATGNYIDASIVNDNLSDYAQFYWQISSVTTDSEGQETKQSLTQGNTTISGADYTAWGQSADINLAAYQYICSKLNLTLVP
jgi:hypothetical protein